MFAPYITRWQHVQFLSSSVGRLLLAAALGGIVGLDRTLHRKSAGIRTNMFICVGAAMFTILSNVLPDPSVADRTRIASNVVQGVGFLGAGAILHGKGGISGLTTAATIWVVASIGMASGGGRYLLATFATITILIALNVFGYLETKLGLKTITMSYEITGSSSPEILDLVNAILLDSHHSMQGPQVGRAQGESHVLFSVTCTLPEHEQLLEKLKLKPEFHKVSAFNASSDE